MFNTTKLHPLSVTLRPIADKGWTFLPEVDSTIWIVKNNNGVYSEPYSVKVVANAEIDSNTKGCLIFISTHIEDYLDNVSSMFDIIGTSEEDVRSKAHHLFTKQQEATKQRKEMLAAFYNK